MEVEAALGARLLDSNRGRVAGIVKDLRPMFDSLDKNEYGKLGHTAVRYALHRLFVARHGWLMKGLDPAGDHFNASSPVKVLEGKASMHLQGIFEKRLSGQGFGLQELATFASVLETLISMEVTERLETLYKKFHISKDATIPVDEADQMLDTYMALYILGRNVDEDDLNAKALKQVVESMPDVYSYWKETQALVRDARANVIGQRKQYSLKDVSDVLVQVGERFGKFQNAECQGLKQKLVNLEDDEQGCVPLASFYKRMFESKGADWQFGENVEYLKQNGMIDQSDPGNLKIMVANYLNGPANCIASSHYYAVCCIDECESLLGHIELQLQAPTAPSDVLASVVAALSSSTVAANRTLPPSQLHRLHKIAEKHDGRVPIHGRLFMQWMHMVYPRECAYPHLSGTIKPLTPDAWSDSTDKNPTATEEEMAKFINAPVNPSSVGQGQCGRWVDEEELFVGAQQSSRRHLAELETDVNTWLATSSVALLCMLAVMTLAVIHSFKSMKQTLCGGQSRQLMYV